MNNTEMDWLTKVQQYATTLYRLTHVDGAEIGCLKDGPTKDPYPHLTSYFERMHQVRADFFRLGELAREITTENYRRWGLSERNIDVCEAAEDEGVDPPPFVPVPGTNGRPLGVPDMPEASKEWKDRRRVFPPEVPPFPTLLGCNTDIPSAKATFNSIMAAPLPGQDPGSNPWRDGISDLEFLKIYRAWRSNWGNMVREWVPVHAGEDELPRFVAFARAAGRVTTRRRRRLVAIDTSKPIGPGNVRWSGSKFACSSGTYQYAKARAAYKKLTEFFPQPSPPWQSFVDFSDDVGFPPKTCADKGGVGGNIYRLFAKDPALPIGKGNTVWGVRAPGVTTLFPVTYRRTFRVWGRLRGDWAAQGPWPKEWVESFRLFSNPTTGPGPVPSDAPSGSQKPRWTLGRKDPSKPHAVGNTFWVEKVAEVPASFGRVKQISLFQTDPEGYKRTRYFWGKLRAGGLLPEEWDDFRVFSDPRTGPGPVPAAPPDAGLRPRWTLGRKDTSKPHAHGNSFWEIQ
jgi:hypothetical protein